MYKYVFKNTVLILNMVNINLQIYHPHKHEASIFKSIKRVLKKGIKSIKEAVLRLKSLQIAMVSPPP